MNEVHHILDKLREVVGKLDAQFPHYQILPIVRGLENDVRKLLDENDATLTDAPVSASTPTPVVDVVEPVRTSADVEAEQAEESNVTPITATKKNRPAAVKPE